jgi:C4-dicarboxylate-specific signal transduction histidine kinase
MASEGRIDISKVKVLSPRPPGPDFPYLRSTRLYPEWPLAKLKGTPDELAEKVAVALLGLTPDDPAARAAHIAGWTVPLDYQPVHALMKELRVGPYRDLGRVTPADVFREYRPVIISGLVFLALLLAAMLYVARLNRRLVKTGQALDRELTQRKKAEADLAEANDRLEERVRQRTAELSEAAERLRRESAERLRAEEAARMQQEQLLQADKLVALGVLVAGVAHEINNPTASIMVNAPNVLKIWRGLAPALDDLAEVKGDFQVGGWTYSQARERVPLLLEGINDGARRIKRIVSDLKSFARQEAAGGAGPVDLNQVVENSLSLLGNLIKKSTHDFRFEPTEGLPPMMGLHQRLEQVVINLVMNACQALEDPSQGLTVRTSPADGGRAVALEVEDRGVGMPPEVLNRITDPFFTTKRETGGTGLGLSISARIIDEHGGRLEFHSEPGRGTKARVILPAREVRSPINGVTK